MSPLALVPQPLAVLVCGGTRDRLAALTGLGWYFNEAGEMVSTGVDTTRAREVALSAWDVITRLTMGAALAEVAERPVPAAVPFEAPVLLGVAGAPGVCKHGKTRREKCDACWERVAHE